jgi:oligoribonuclease NrnB/cAMP/cGMP phosphodiesterase (DHH superfamily)
MIHVFYHNNDLDGLCSGAIARMYLEGEKEKFAMHPIDYPDPFPGDRIKARDTVYMLDYSIKIEGIRVLNEKTKLIIIDHHKTLLDNLNADPVLKKIKGLRETSKAGCELCWEYFFPKKHLPKMVKLLGRYDVWDHTNEKTWNEEIFPFQNGIKLLKLNPCKNSQYKNWQDAFKGGNCFVKNIIKKGKIILEYQKEQNEFFMTKYAFDDTFDQYRALCINHPLGNSQVFISQWNEKEYDLMFRYCFMGNNYIVSLYTTKKDLDLGLVAKKYGGGGHPQAAGFECENIKFNHKRKIKITKIKDDRTSFEKFLHKIKECFHGQKRIKKS